MTVQKNQVNSYNEFLKNLQLVGNLPWDTSQRLTTNTISQKVPTFWLCCHLTDIKDFTHSFT